MLVDPSVNPERIYKGISKNDYIPEVVKRLKKIIDKEIERDVILFGFSENMKWLSRLLKEDNRSYNLADWRESFINYFCSDEKVDDINKFNPSDNQLIVFCPEEIHIMKEGMYFLMRSDFKFVPTIYERHRLHSPYHEEEPYKSIKENAIKRAKSMLSDTQLFDLIQLVKLTKSVEGCIVEYGCMHGGSSAMLLEASNFYGSRNLHIYDTFTGIPKSKYGLDFFWKNAFSNNSYSEVKKAFSDCSNVYIHKGNILETHKNINEPISFAYLASDTLESGEVLLEYVWKYLSIGGVLAVCDYGSYPNCIPLTMITDEFLKIKKNAFAFKTERLGIYIMKIKN